MSRSLSSSRWVGSLSAGCTLLVVLTHFSFAQVGEPTTGARKESPAGARTAGLKQDIEQAVKQLEKNEIADFIDDYFPVDQLRGLREITSVRIAARDPRLDKGKLKRLATLLALCAKAKPKFSKDDGIATFEVTLPPEKVTAIATEPEPVASTKQLTGFGKDLPAALAAVANAAKDQKWEAFILGFYPLTEAQHLEATGELKDQLYVIAENPRMVEAMQRDLAAMQKMTPKLSEKDTVAEYRFPASGANDRERILRLQLADGNWRLFDSATSVRKVIRASTTGGTLSGETITINWERFGKRWRLFDLSMIE